MLLESILGGAVLGAGMSIYNMFKDNKDNENRTKEEWQEFLDSTAITNKAKQGLTFDSHNSSKNFVLFHCPYGISKEDIKSKEVYFKIFLDATRLEYTIKDKWLRMFYFKEELPELVPYEYIEPADGTFEIFLGKSTNDYSRIDFYKTPHVLIAGVTGSGKSCLTHVILTQLYRHKVNPIMYLADLKRSELIDYKNHKNTGKYLTSLEDVSEMINELLEECDNRYELFTKVGAKKLETYNSKVSKKEQLRPIVVVIEECIRLVSDKKLQKNLAELLFIARACGIYIVLTIQRPTKSCIDSDIKASLGNIIGLKTINRVNSQVICDDDRLRNLRGNGHGWVFNDSGEVEFQSFYIPEDDISKYLI